MFRNNNNTKIDIMPNVNLDALIPRADFETSNVNNKIVPIKYTISITELIGDFFYPFLRKPDFQRVTNDWKEKDVLNFLESYTNGDLIPSIILWRNSYGLYFVIDGAHRLSALLSWAFDDYGDGEISKQFYGMITPEQEKVADHVRNTINKKIGSFKTISEATKNPTADHKYITIAKNIGAFALTAQWVPGDDILQAEKSFRTINKTGVPLKEIELKLLTSRKKGNCIAARAIIRGGKGHKFWGNFPAEKQSEIESIADEIHKIFFEPPLESPIKSRELPFVGKALSSDALPLVFDIVNIVNQIPTDFETKKNKDGQPLLMDDTTGEDTLRFLKNVRTVAWIINSAHSSSLGLHPMVYFYSADGRHKPASVMPIVAWISDTKSQRKGFKDFIKVRNKFEDLLLKYSYLIQDINRALRQSISSYIYVKTFYVECLNLLLRDENMSIDDVILEINKIKPFTQLKINSQAQEVTTADFSTTRKSAVFIREALQSAIRCPYCKARLPERTSSIDHIIPKNEGGNGAVDNGQLMHHYCNSIKDSK